uniref:ZF-HD homeobox protein At4g24660 family n=1 Tax=Cajanus cajan TaxID=3821 RepID=A0A151TIB4_CAJCA|nr:ZF-HD homeobox protein At4g24660 family [Cajanus cajan]
METRGQDKEIEIPTTTTLGYSSSSSSSKLSSSTLGERSSSDHDQHHQTPHQPHTLISPHHNLYPPPQPPSLAPPQPHHRPTSDPDLTTPIAPTSNPSRTTPQTITTITTATATTSSQLIRYRECLRNHAASMGSHVVDGCGEFMASGEEGTPESLRCAACECHRNFHRKEVEGELSQPQPQSQLQPPPQPQHVPNYHHNYYTNKHNGPAESSSEDLNMFQSNTGAQVSVQAPLSKKRFRTKFSQQQKDRMMEFADKIGWKIQKHNDQEVQQFCSQVGVKRQVFKVWMHNNKQTTSKKQQM